VPEEENLARWSRGTVEPRANCTTAPNGWGYPTIQRLENRDI
jgi:hypothetical protein